MTKYLLPILIICLLIFALIKRVNCYDVFVRGAKKSFDLIYIILPYIVAIMLIVTLLRVSGITNWLTTLIAPIFNFLGIPYEVCELVFLRPLTGSGSFALLENIFKNYGVDSYISRTACVIMGSSETVFYCASIYFSKTQTRKLLFAIPLALFCSFLASLLASLLCKII